MAQLVHLRCANKEIGHPQDPKHSLRANKELGWKTGLRVRPFFLFSSNRSQSSGKLRSRKIFLGINE